MKSNTQNILDTSPVGARCLGPCAPLHGNLGMGFIEALREGRGGEGQQGGKVG